METNRSRDTLIRHLFSLYIERYANRDVQLMNMFSENFSGYTGGGDFLVHERDEWIQITRQDFDEVSQPIQIEVVDISLQDLASTVVAVTAFFHIHLPFKDSILSRETARLTLIFADEGTPSAPDWKITHSGISIPYHLVKPGEVYPVQTLQDRNQELERLIAERTQELEEANSKLQALSFTDGLTGIGNRRYFDMMLEKEWNRALQDHSPVSLIIVDVDYFKLFNDRYGHLAGDQCLQRIANVLKNCARRASDTSARFGGEEFVLLLPNATDRTAYAIATLIQQHITELNIPHADRPAGQVSVSMGIASLRPITGQQSKALVRSADIALYRAKKKGRNRIEPDYTSSNPLKFPI